MSTLDLRQTVFNQPGAEVRADSFKAWGEINCGGRTLIQTSIGKPFITTQGPTIIRNAVIQLNHELPGGEHPAQDYGGVHCGPGTVIFENVTLLNVVRCGFWMEASSGSAFRDVQIIYHQTPKAYRQVGIFSGHYNVTNLEIDRLNFDGAGIADGAINISKGADIWISRSLIRNYELEGICLQAGPATVERTSFFTPKPFAGSKSISMFVDIEGMHEGGLFIRSPRYALRDLDITGGAWGVSTGDSARKNDPLVSAVLDNITMREVKNGLNLCNVQSLSARDCEIDAQEIAVNSTAPSDQKINQEFRLSNSFVSGQIGFNIASPVRQVWMRDNVFQTSDIDFSITAGNISSVIDTSGCRYGSGTQGGVALNNPNARVRWNWLGRLAPQFIENGKARSFEI